MAAALPAIIGGAATIFGSKKAGSAAQAQADAQVQAAQLQADQAAQQVALQKQYLDYIKGQAAQLDPLRQQMIQNALAEMQKNLPKPEDAYNTAYNNAIGTMTTAQEGLINEADKYKPIQDIIRGAITGQGEGGKKFAQDLSNIINAGAGAETQLKDISQMTADERAKYEASRQLLRDIAAGKSLGSVLTPESQRIIQKVTEQQSKDVTAQVKGIQDKVKTGEIPVGVGQSMINQLKMGSSSSLSDVMRNVLGGQTETAMARNLALQQLSPTLAEQQNPLFQIAQIAAQRPELMANIRGQLLNQAMATNQFAPTPGQIAASYEPITNLQTALGNLLGGTAQANINYQHQLPFTTFDTLNPSGMGGATSALSNAFSNLGATQGAGAIGQGNVAAANQAATANLWGNIGNMLSGVDFSKIFGQKPQTQLVPTQQLTATSPYASYNFPSNQFSAGAGGVKF